MNHPNSYINNVPNSKEYPILVLDENHKNFERISIELFGKIGHMSRAGEITHFKNESIYLMVLTEDELCVMKLASNVKVISIYEYSLATGTNIA